ncbi:NAD(P)-binding protein [Violaceomyces palustris]|uniref:NAD(P)-binding protein n=1 Tax=Violaceomyces palustris TaxID=1673888 RepID=A0ACD0NLR5_9BASI|nr:NAD(P)-binding protein [Violaceomyces palustris]
MADEHERVQLPHSPSTSTFKDDIFKGKVLFCTGGGSGICYEMTKAIMTHGAQATIVGRKAERLESAAQSLSQSTGKRCIAASGDVRKPEDLANAVRKTIEAFGRIDFVICGAAGNFLAPIEGISSNAFRTVLEIDLLGTYNTIKATLEEVKKTRGSYLHVSATLHYSGIPWQSAPSAAKAGVDALSNALAVEMGPLGVRSNCVAPGAIRGTEGMERLAPKGSEDLIDLGIPLQKMGEKGDIASVGVFLFSPAATWITGEVIVCDGGGRHFQGPMLPYPTSTLDPQAIKSLVTGSKL